MALSPKIIAMLRVSAAPRVIAALAIIAMAAAAPAPRNASAATITTNEAAMDAIFSQASFGASPVDIRFASAVELTAPAQFFDIDTETELLILFAQAEALDLYSALGLAPNNVFMYFVDQLSWCGGFNVNIVGCAGLSDANNTFNDIVVESAFAAGSKGAELNSHELGHNLGLVHEDTVPNLMNPFLNDADGSLTSNQVATILNSPLLQLDGNDLFISITPVLISAVPLPAALPLLLSGLVGLGAIARRRKRAAA